MRKGRHFQSANCSSKFSLASFQMILRLLAQSSLHSFSGPSGELASAAPRGGMEDCYSLGLDGVLGRVWLYEGSCQKGTLQLASICMLIAVQWLWNFHTVWAPFVRLDWPIGIFLVTDVTLFTWWREQRCYSMSLLAHPWKTPLNGWDPSLSSSP